MELSPAAQQARSEPPPFDEAARNAAKQLAAAAGKPQTQKAGLLAIHAALHRKRFRVDEAAYNFYGAKKQRFYEWKPRVEQLSGHASTLSHHFKQQPRVDETQPPPVMQPLRSMEPPPPPQPPPQRDQAPPIMQPLRSMEPPPPPQPPPQRDQASGQHPDLNAAMHKILSGWLVEVADEVGFQHVTKAVDLVDHFLRHTSACKRSEFQLLGIVCLRKVSDNSFSPELAIHCTDDTYTLDEVRAMEERVSALPPLPSLPSPAHQLRDPLLPPPESQLQPQPLSPLHCDCSVLSAWALCDDCDVGLFCDAAHRGARRECGGELIRCHDCGTVRCSTNCGVHILNAPEVPPWFYQSAPRTVLNTTGMGYLIQASAERLTESEARACSLQDLASQLSDWMSCHDPENWVTGYTRSVCVRVRERNQIDGDPYIRWRLWHTQYCRDASAPPRLRINPEELLRVLLQTEFDTGAGVFPRCGPDAAHCPSPFFSGFMLVDDSLHRI